MNIFDSDKIEEIKEVKERSNILLVNYQESIRNATAIKKEQNKYTSNKERIIEDENNKIPKFDNSNIFDNNIY